MNKLSSFLNYIISAIFLCLFFYSFFYSVTKSGALSLLLIVVVFAIFSFFYFFFKNKRELKRGSTKTQLLLKEKLKIWLLTTSDRAVYELLSPQFDLESQDCHLLFNNVQITEYQLFDALKKGNKTVNIFCISYPKELESYARSRQDLAVQFYTLDEIFERLFSAEKLPNLDNINVIKRKSFKEIITLALSKQKQLGYAILSLTFLFTSFFTPFKVYYRIASFIMLATFVAIFFIKETAKTSRKE